jgi:hypothetical protein
MRHQPPMLITIRIKSVSQALMSKFKAENPDFDLDFDAFVKDITNDETVGPYLSGINYSN